jgi:hypothetical protein
MCFCGIDTRGPESAAPYRKNRRNAGSRKVPLAVCPHVLEEQIAENHAGHAGSSGVADRLRHFLLVNLVRAGKWNVHDDREQTRSIQLRSQQLFADAVHADSTESIRDRCQSSDDIEIAGPARFMQRPRAVLAARPGDECL